MGSSMGGAMVIIRDSWTGELLAQQQSMNFVSSTQWVLPSKHITGGDAWMLELPGFAVFSGRLVS